MNTFSRIMLLGVACSVLCGCYNGKEVEAFLTEARGQVAGVPYRVYPPDTIRISSQHVPEINEQTQQIRPDGKINLPLIGEMFVSGLTPKEVEEALTKAAAEYYEQADATVTVVGYLSQKFYVLGQVSRPGPMPWTGRDTLLDALAKAHPTNLAWPERITVIRGSRPDVGGYVHQETPMPSNQYRNTGVYPATKDKPRNKMTFNLMAMVKSGDMANNILLQPNDVIYVRPNPMAAIGLAIQNMLFPVRPAIEAVGMPAVVAY